MEAAAAEHESVIPLHFHRDIATIISTKRSPASTLTLTTFMNAGSPHRSSNVESADCLQVSIPIVAGEFLGRKSPEL